MNKNLFLGLGILVAVFVVGAGLVYFGGSKPSYSPSPAAVALGTPAASSMPSEEGVREIAVEGDEYEFSPEELSFTNGEKVKLTFVNKGKLPHNLTIDELGVATETIPGGKSTTIEFSVDKSGSFTAYCSVGNHRSLGMEGKVEVK
ncbi:cupredoxin domain-containing protein [Candidatus Microgenomates bacterium]|nr:cupredoxin domain-containing protein [Candidatus Microgenomates bacterium]